MQEHTHRHTPTAFMDPHNHQLDLKGGSIPLTVTGIVDFNHRSIEHKNEYMNNMQIK